jgi:hypothetical protein
MPSPVAPQEAPGVKAAPLDPEIVIRIAADGRVYFHDLTAPMLPVARALAPADVELARREQLARNFSQVSP